jgi:hypothetical protein
MSKIAPVVLFVYARLDHLQQTIEALQKNYLAKETKLIIYSDNAVKESHEADVLAVRNYLKTISGFESVEISEAKQNKGLAKSIIEGVTEQVNKYDRIIVMEDDLVSSPYMLNFMNEALDFYQNEDRVMQISAYSYPSSKFIPETYFMSLASSWGWATWKRAWNHLSLDTDAHIENIRKRNLENRFNIEGGMSFFCHLTMNQEGSLNTWAVKWYASVFLRNGLVLYPKTSLIRNIGHDGSGMNCTEIEDFKEQKLASKVRVKKMPLKENERARAGVSKFMKQSMHFIPTPLQRIKNKVRDKIKYELSKLRAKKS